MADHIPNIVLKRLKYTKEEFKAELASYLDLDKESIELISKDFFEIFSKDRSRDPYIVWSEVLMKWGVMCKHPIEMRMYGRKKIIKTSPDTEHKWFECKACTSIVLNPFYVKKQNESIKKKKIEAK